MPRKHPRPAAKANRQKLLDKMAKKKAEPKRVIIIDAGPVSKTLAMRLGLNRLLRSLRRTS